MDCVLCHEESGNLVLLEGPTSAFHVIMCESCVKKIHGIQDKQTFKKELVTGDSG